MDEAVGILARRRDDADERLLHLAVVHSGRAQKSSMWRVCNPGGNDPGAVLT
jgi:hypothetical protein